MPRSLPLGLDLEQELQSLLKLALEEDGEHDITSEALFEPGIIKDATIVAKEEGTACGVRFLETIAHAVDPNILVEPFVEEGMPLKHRMLVAGFQGDLRSLLRAERILLNFLSRLSGVATLTTQFVKEISKTGAVILDTRKTIPGWRYLDKYAVSVGGGINHRMNLESIAMIKDTHIDAAGGLGNALKAFFEKGERKPLIVEVRDLEELSLALLHAKSLHRILLDNFSVDLMKKSVGMASGKVLLEASGNITLSNVRQIAESGVHFLSIGALTHSTPGFDFSFKIS